MKTAWTILLGLVLVGAVSGCCCFGDRACGTCCTATPEAPVVGALATPEVTIQ